MLKPENVFTVLNDGFLPARAYPTDAGADLCATQSVQIKPGEVVKISTGVHIALPKGTFGLIADRSSMGKRGLKVMGGIVDETYRGELGVMLANVKQVSFWQRFCDWLRAYPLDYSETIQVGDKIAQLLIIPCLTPKFFQVDSLNNTDRGSGGFGSTGV